MIIAENLLSLANAARDLGSPTLQEWLHGDWDMVAAIETAEAGDTREDITFGFGYLLGYSEAIGMTMAQTLDLVPDEDSEGIR